MAELSQDDIYQAIRQASAEGKHDDVIRLSQYLQHMNRLPPGTDTEPPSPARQAGQEFVRKDPWGTAVGGLNQLVQGATLGWGDELGGAISSAVRDPFHPTQQYAQERDRLRGVSDAFREDFPVAGLAGDVGGSLLLGGPFKAAAQAMSGPGNVGKLARIGQSSVIGAGAGGVTGAGQAETVQNAPFQALKHAAFGAVASPFLEGLGMTAAGGVNAVRGLYGGAGARELAQRRVAESIARGGQTAQQAKTFMGQQKFGGPEGEAVIADTSDAARNLLDTVATLPGKTSDVAANFLRRRRVETPQRMDVLPDMLNQGRRYDTTLDLLNKVQAQAAKPAYAAVDNVVVPITPQLENLFQTPAFRQAYAQAAKNAANRREPLPSLDDLQKMGPVGGLPVKVWDNIKRGFDDVIASKKGPPNPSNQAQNTLRDTRDIKNEMVAEIDRLTNGAYKVARDAHAGPAALKDALEEGTSAWSKSGAEIRAQLATMSQSEQQAFRIGVGEVLRAKVGSPSGQTELINAWKDRNLREKLEAIYGTPQNYNKAISKLFGEEQLAKLYRTNTGSATARRLAGHEDMAAGIAEDIAPAAISPSPLSMWAAAKKVTSRVANPEPVRDEVGRILLQGGRRGREELARLNEIVRLYNEKAAQQAAVTGVMGSSFGMPFVR